MGFANVGSCCCWPAISPLRAAGTRGCVDSVRASGWHSVTFTASQIGFVSLLGVAGVIGTQLIGRVFDRGWSAPATGMGLAITLVSVAVSVLGGSSIVTLLIAVALLLIGVQAVLVLLQTMIVSMDPAARSRLKHCPHSLQRHLRCNRVNSCRRALGGRPVARRLGGSAVVVAYALGAVHHAANFSLKSSRMRRVPRRLDEKRPLMTCFPSRVTNQPRHCTLYYVS